MTTELDQRRRSREEYRGSRSGKGWTVAEFELTSEAFADGEPIPRRHTCEGDDISPPLAWSGVPEGTVTLALICDDPDAPSGTFTHWVAWGIDPGSGRLAEGESAPREGRSGFGDPGYRGPCPPPGHGVHRYFFRLHALDADPSLEEGAERETLERAIETQSLGSAELVGTYERPG
jgi:Raf kinase inhibitor-like YbhB/YbcL family protein